MPIILATEKEKWVMIHIMTEELNRVQGSNGNHYGLLNLEELKSLIEKLTIA